MSDRTLMTVELSVVEPRNVSASDVGLTLRNEHMEVQIVHVPAIWNFDLDGFAPERTVEVVVDSDGFVRYVIGRSGLAYDPSSAITP